LIILNRFQRLQLLLPSNPSLPSSQICSIPYYFTPLQPLTIPPLPLLRHPSLLTHHSLTPSLPYHHMYVYLTILLQVQLVDWSLLVSNMTPLLVLG
jgi:hypothetical protein